MEIYIPIFPRLVFMYTKVLKVLSHKSIFHILAILLRKNYFYTIGSKGFWYVEKLIMWIRVIFEDIYVIKNIYDFIFNFSQISNIFYKQKIVSFCVCLTQLNEWYILK